MKIIKERETCPYFAIFAKEKTSSRLIFENNECIAFAPYYSIGSFEVWILPRRHVSFLGNCNDKLLFALGDILRASLRNYRRVLENIPFNYMFYQLFKNSEYHLNLRLLPRLSISAGFELNTGTYIKSSSSGKSCLIFEERSHASRINTD
jgi:UDPglucose--hexose-1-phosphate uridylyltransferase